MKHNILYFAAALALAAGTASCSKDPVYSSHTVKQVLFTLDGKETTMQQYGSSNTRPLFLYYEDGSYYENLNSYLPFTLNDGTYKVFATNQSALVTTTLAANLNDIVVPQDSDAKTSFAISKPIEYHTGDEMKLDLLTRTGVLRIKAEDVKGDKRYNQIRATVTSPISAYKVSDGNFLEDGVTLVKTADSKNGGISYVQDFILMETKTNGRQVDLAIDFLKDGETVEARPSLKGDPIVISPKDTTIVSLRFNKDDTMVQDYTVEIHQADWTEETLTPEAPFIVPEGYTYVSPQDNMDNVLTELMADASVDEIKLYLKAGESYAFGSKTLNDITKALYVMAQKPKTGQPKATLDIPGTISMKGDMSAVHFENLNITATNAGKGLFKLKGQKFHVEEIAFVNCDFDSFSGTLWYQETGGDYEQVVDHVLFDGTTFTNLQLSGSALFGLSTKKVAPIYNWTFRNSTFHMKSFGKPLVNNMTKIDKTLTVDIENCTFVDMAGVSTTWFELKGDNTSAFNLIVRKNLFSGTSTSRTTAFNTNNKVTSSDIVENYRTKDFTFAVPGIDPAPEELTDTMDDLFNDAAAGDLTVKNHASVVYTKGIGANRWTK